MDIIERSEGSARIINYLCNYDLYSDLFWMCAYPLLGQVGGGWALEIESFLGPVNLFRTTGWAGSLSLISRWRCGNTMSL
jgi:hypothetical protein